MFFLEIFYMIFFHKKINIYSKKQENIMPFKPCYGLMGLPLQTCREELTQKFNMS